MREDLYPSRTNKEKIFPRIDPTVYSKEMVGKHSLNENELKYYEENGFIIFPNIFSKDEVEQLKEELKKLENNEELRKKDEFITEPNSEQLRTIFNQHLFSKVYEKLSKDSRILDKVKQILGSDVYIHHGRINIKRAYNGKSFPWHSDFETWHSEDGLPNCRCLSAWIMISDNTQFNGPLYLLKGSHKYFISCKGQTPENNYKKSLKKQEYGVPSLDSIKTICCENDIVSALGSSGTLVLHDGNIIHGSSDNISMSDRTNAFFVFNSIMNKPQKPFGAKTSRADFLCLKDFDALSKSIG